MDPIREQYARTGANGYAGVGSTECLFSWAPTMHLHGHYSRDGSERCNVVIWRDDPAVWMSSRGFVS
jgi:hypothetical protein